VIVRIATEGQYEIDDAHAAQVDAIDHALIAAVEAGDEAGFHERFAELLALVREAGRELDHDELAESDVILPPPDLSFAEAGAEFKGEGLLPG
jgi:hypothetical protein